MDKDILSIILNDDELTIPQNTTNQKFWWRQVIRFNNQYNYEYYN